MSESVVAMVKVINSQIQELTVTNIIWLFSPEGTVPFGEATWSIWPRHKGHPVWEPSHLSMQDVWKMCLQLWSFRTLSSSSKGAKQITHSVWFVPSAAPSALYWNVIECDSKLTQPETLWPKDVPVAGWGGMSLVWLHHPSMVKLKNVNAIISDPTMSIPVMIFIWIISCYGKKPEKKGICGDTYRDVSWCGWQLLWAQHQPNRSQQCWSR